jgi:hypothetical protein
MLQRIEAEPPETIKVALLKIRGRWFHYDLKLIVVLQPVGVLAVTTVLGPTARLNISRIPVLGP